MSLDLSVPDDAPDLSPSADLQSLIERIETVEARAADATALDELATRLDRIETRLARPSARIEVREDDDAIERKAFVNWLRHGDRISDHDKRVLAEVERKVLSVGGGGSPELGGAQLVPQQFVQEILRHLVLINPIRRVARVQNVSGGPVLLPKRVANLQASWIAEGAQHPTDEPSYTQQSVAIFEARVTSEVTNQLLEDSAFNLDAELAFDLAQEFARLEGAAFTTGNGTSEPKGFLIGGDINVTVTPITADSIIDLFYALPELYRNNSTWLMNGSVIGTVRKLKTSGTGVYLWTDSLAPGQPPSLLGRPVVEVPNMSLPASPAAQTMAIGDWSQTYRIFDRVGLDILRDPYSRARNSIVAFHARRRVGGAVVRGEAARILHSV
jgi:HK97 family phage major capsid protein